MQNLQQTNHLAKESSPYLQQHAHNPVNWYPWGDEALEKARRENKPVLLSIGYAACHWCHVMAHESFEDKATAELMNRLFVNIKVDREERPDLDKIYQTAHYLLTQRSGGWPLTIFLTPDDLTPFFSGTYFPLDARYQLPAFKTVLQDIANLYNDRMPDIQQQNIELQKILQHEIVAPAAQLNGEPLQLAAHALQGSYDEMNGGFGGAPKFPHPAILEFLLHYASPMAADTLRNMADGGIYDQLAGGFFRYSVDAYWRIPHFEKMLYDNGLLIFLYAQAAVTYNQPLFADIARETGEWLMHTMQSPEGGYFSSINADSEGHEGKFYVWEKQDIEALLTPDQYAVINLYFGLDNAPNFENRWHLYVAQSLESIAAHLNMPSAKARKLLHTAKHALLNARQKRIAPSCDTKILTAWNALAIKGMITAGVTLQHPAFIDSALRALDFIHQKLWQQQRLLAVYKDDNKPLPAYLDDYAFLLDALLTVLQSNWRSDYLQWTVELADAMLQHFFDANNGGFFFTADDHEKLLYRPKIMMDEAIPSGNGVAVRVLLTLGYLLGEPRYINAAEKTLLSTWPALARFPIEHCELLSGLKAYLAPPTIIIIRGNEKDSRLWQAACKTNSNIVFAIASDEQNLPPALATKKIQGKVCAYVCQGNQCLDVITDIEQLKENISLGQ